MATRERRSAAVWLFVAPALILFSVGTVVGLYALVDGLNRGDPIPIGLGLVVVPICVYLEVKFLRAPLRTRPKGSNPP